MSPSKGILKSFVNLKHNKDWILVLEWLRQEHIKAAIDSTHIGGDLGLWLQGQAQALEMLLKRIDDAEHVLEADKLDAERPTGPIV